MINLNFGIANPWRSNYAWDILWNKSGNVTKYKAWEFNGYHSGYIVNVGFDLRFKGDHAGLQLQFGIFGYEVELHFYDIRHWDYETNQWHT